MTDIQRHLKGIRKILQHAVMQAAPEGKLDIPALTSALRAFLPKSYGIGSGKLVSENGQSLPIQLLLYDVPLAGSEYAPDADEFRIEHALFVLDAAVHHTSDSFADALERIASVKRLTDNRVRAPRPPDDEPPGQSRRIIPKDRLPFALMYFDRFEQFAPDDERLFARLHRLMQAHPHEHWPEQMDIIGQQAQFLNTLLTESQTGRFDIGLSRVPDLKKPELCYVCKQKYFRQHFFYAQLCMRCGDLNYCKRIDAADLTGHKVLVTGARLKIGYAVALRLLRAGAEVLATSRFPHDTAQRYASEPDFADWCSRLHIFGLDMRQMPRVEAFISYLEANYPYLDAVINNAAQTVKRPAGFYAHLMPGETAARESLPDTMRGLLRGQAGDTGYLPVTAQELLTSGDETTFPTGQYDEHGQQVDNRTFNSWVMRLEDIPPLEMLEVHLVNAIAPGILAGQLKRLLVRSPHAARYIINVTAAEGRFAQFKNGFHPHTNMAKAALNMLTRTIADEYAADGIYVTSVDPGWVSDQVPRTGSESRQTAAERLPVDMTDAAARVCDPIFAGVAGEAPVYGKLLKDYEVVSW